MSLSEQSNCPYKLLLLLIVSQVLSADSYFNPLGAEVDMWHREISLPYNLDSK